MTNNNVYPFILNFAISLLIACVVYRIYQRHQSKPNQKYQTFCPRFWVPSIDFIILWPLVSLLPFLLSMILTESILNMIQLFLCILQFAYSIYFHGAYGATIGKMACRVKVVDAKTEQPITMRQALIRDSIPLVFILLLIGFNFTAIKSLPVLFLVIAVFYLWFFAEIITMLTNEKRRAVHDFIAGTVVIRSDLLVDSAQEQAYFYYGRASSCLNSLPVHTTRSTDNPSSSAPLV